MKLDENECINYTLLATQPNSIGIDQPHFQNSIQIGRKRVWCINKWGDRIRSLNFGLSQQKFHLLLKVLTIICLIMFHSA